MNKTQISICEMAPLIYEQLDSHGEVVLKVTGSSMKPMLYPDRDFVIISRIDRKLKRNDLPFYKIGEKRFILHRIIKVNKDGTFLCQGDNKWTTEAITKENIIGVVTGFVRNGKRKSVKSLTYRFYVFVWPLIHHFKWMYRICILFLNKIRFKAGKK